MWTKSSFLLLSQWLTGPPSSPLQPKIRLQLIACTSRIETPSFSLHTHLPYVSFLTGAHDAGWEPSSLLSSLFTWEKWRRCVDSDTKGGCVMFRWSGLGNNIGKLQQVCHQKWRHAWFYFIDICHIIVRWRCGIIFHFHIACVKLSGSWLLRKKRRTIILTVK